MPVLGQRAAARRGADRRLRPRRCSRRWAARPAGGCSPCMRSLGREPFTPRRTRPARGVRRPGLGRARARPRPAARAPCCRCRPTATASPATCTTTSSSGSSPPALSLDRISRSLEPDDPDVAARLVAQRRRAATAPSPEIRTSIFELHEAEDASPAAVRRPAGRGGPVGHRRARRATATCGSGTSVDDLPPTSCSTSSRWSGSWSPTSCGTPRASRLTVAVDRRRRGDASWSPTTAAGSRRSRCAAAWPTWPTAPSAGADGCRRRPADSGTEVSWSVPAPRPLSRGRSVSRPPVAQLAWRGSPPASAAPARAWPAGGWCSSSPSSPPAPCARRSAGW